MLRWAVMVLAIGSVGCASKGTPLPPGAQWTPAAWTGEDTIALRSDCDGEGEKWSPVWLVVLDDQLYVRLGSRAAGRVQCNRDGKLPVRIAGAQFDDTIMTPVPDLAVRVADAMADKYPSDVLVRYFPHPLTLRIAPR